MNRDDLIANLIEAIQIGIDAYADKDGQFAEDTDDVEVLLTLAEWMALAELVQS